jgi:hypothetical protein
MPSLGEETAIRTVSDRRKRPTPFISRYSFTGGQRKIIRRGEDKKKYIFVDLYSTRLFATLLFLLILNVSDSYFTLALVRENIAVEINPLMAFFLGYGSTPFISAKFLIPAVPVFILCICKNRPMTKILLPLAIFFYLLIILYELNLMYQVLPPFDKLNYVF